MNKSEFLNILRESLSGEIATSILEQNISYYDGYISAQTIEEEERTIDGLGDPRLIAKTIVEAERAAKEKNKSNWSTAEHQEYSSGPEDNEKEQSTGFNQNIFLSKMQWYHKLIAIVVIVVLFVIIAVIGRLVIGFLFAFGLPILLLILVMSLFRRR